MSGGGICPHSVVTPHMGFWMRNDNWRLNLQWSQPTSTPSLLHEQTSFPSILLGISSLSGFISKIISISKSSLQDCLLSKFYKSPLSQPSITFIPTPNLKLQPSTKSHTLSTDTQIHSCFILGYLPKPFLSQRRDGQRAKGQVEVSGAKWLRKVALVTYFLIAIHFHFLKLFLDLYQISHSLPTPIPSWCFCGFSF